MFPHSSTTSPRYLKVLVFVLFFLFTLFQLACGVPGEPLPPLLEIPQPIEDLTINQVGDSLRLSWTRPTLTTEDTRIRQPISLEIFGAYFANPQIEISKQDFIQVSSSLATLSSQVDTSEISFGHALLLSEQESGKYAYFAIRASNDRGKDAGLSNIVSRLIINLPLPPSNLVAELTENAIVLRWQATNRNIFGGPAIRPDGYHVYRSDDSSGATSQWIATWRSTEYSDASFSFGLRYIYSIEPFLNHSSGAEVSSFSKAVSIDAIDRFAPAPPQNLRAVAEAGIVELVWSAGAEPDLAGYNVYRDEGGGFTKLNTGLLLIPISRDTSAKPSARVRYHVRSIDLSGNESVPSEETSILLQ